MDGKTMAIAGLIALAILFGGMVVSGLRPEPSAYGQGGVYATYLGVTAEVRDDLVQFVIIDSQSRRMVFYSFNQANKRLSIAGGRDLSRDFQRRD
jgi:hypothetical protein